mgnify:CR=1 FL=1
MLNAVIVDDEQNAIDGLIWELSNFKDRIKIVNSFNNPEKAINYLTNNKIDCLFLDIEMPTMDGFQFLNKLKDKDFEIVITTAYNEYAIKALKNNAVDYLLKPVDSDDLELTLNKIETNRQKNTDNGSLEKILLNFNKNNAHKKIIFNTDGKLLFIESNEIIFVESDGNYSTIQTVNKKILVTKKLKEVHSQLPENIFFRIHNSYIVNLNKIKEFYKTDGYVILENDHKIPVSRQRKAAFLDKF